MTTQTPSQHSLLEATPLLDFTAPAIARLVDQKGWAGLPRAEAIGAAYDFVRNAISFGYNMRDDLPASRVLRDGYGQCNTKATLLMALLRRLGVPCRLHGFTIHKSLQRGVVPEPIYLLAPDDILHSWVEVETQDGWVNLEGFILDQPYLQSLQAAFGTNKSLCGYAAGTDNLTDPPVRWCGRDTYIQTTGINADLGLYASPDDFYARHRQDFGVIRNLLYKAVIRHWMNARVARIRAGAIPALPRKAAITATAPHMNAGLPPAGK